MTTNEIMANLEKHCEYLKEINNMLSTCWGDDGVIRGEKYILGKEIEWIEDLMDKHWKEEDKMRSVTMFLHMNERG